MRRHCCLLLSPLLGRTRLIVETFASARLIRLSIMFLSCYSYFKMYIHSAFVTLQKLNWKHVTILCTLLFAWTLRSYNLINLNTAKKTLELHHTTTGISCPDLLKLWRHLTFYTAVVTTLSQVLRPNNLACYMWSGFAGFAFGWLKGLKVV